MQSAFFITITLVSALAGAAVILDYRAFPEEWLSISHVDIPPQRIFTTPTPEQAPVVLPKPQAKKSSLLLQVPFTAQAPIGDWSDPWGDTCEEAVLVMAEAFYRGEKLTLETARSRILDIVSYEETNLGGYGSTSIVDIADIARTFLHFEVSQVDDPTVDVMKKALVNGDLVAAPMAGRMLGNPFFTPPGPPYHMLLIVGFDDTKKEFIVHDPGTRRGKEFRYPYQVIMNALHDWTGSNETIVQGEDRIMVIHHSAS